MAKFLRNNNIIYFTVKKYCAHMEIIIIFNKIKTDFNFNWIRTLPNFYQTILEVYLF